MEIALPEDLDPFVALFSESSGRVLVSAKPDAEDDLAALCRTTAEFPGSGWARSARPDDAVLEVTGQFSLPLAELREAWSRTLREVFAA